jgi:hypothetical protein
MLSPSRMQVLNWNSRICQQLKDDIKSGKKFRLFHLKPSHCYERLSTEGSSDYIPGFEVCMYIQHSQTLLFA